MPNIELVFFVLVLQLLIEGCRSVVILFIQIFAFSKSLIELEKASFPIAFEDVTSLTWATFKFTTFAVLSSKKVYMPYLALWPGLSHLLSPLGLATALYNSSFTILFY